jgi:hypothetical protein
MLNNYEFEDLLLETVYYYKPEDLIQPMTNKRLKADLVRVDGKEEIWIPHSVRKPVKVLNTNTGELVSGFLVKRHFIWDDPERRRNKLRKHTGLKYDWSGFDVKHTDGWRWA